MISDMSGASQKLHTGEKACNNAAYFTLGMTAGPPQQSQNTPQT